MQPIYLLLGDLLQINLHIPIPPLLLLIGPLIIIRGIEAAAQRQHLQLHVLG